MNIELEAIDVRRIKRIKKMLVENGATDRGASTDWSIVSSALELLEDDLLERKVRREER